MKALAALLFGLTCIVDTSAQSTTSGSHQDPFVRDLEFAPLPEFEFASLSGTPPAHVALTATVAPDGSVVAVRVDGVSPQKSTDIVSDQSKARLQAEGERVLRLWRYSRGSREIRFRVTFNWTPVSLRSAGAPQKLVSVEPYLPPEIVGTQRRVAVQAKVARDGRLSDVTVQGAGPAEAALVSALRQWRFTPGDVPVQMGVLATLWLDRAP